ncbi:protein kinase [Evansella sp. AB-P1]|uniref:protein kinase domain-containing protein n=1 Tax=Evansella sp. AB-P1 TaxID=3037653 RepID=UPI00241F1690|nr:protein kinase [Evansella sp. AB-P1]MDG5788347.1 protein kinase [Evansella sp. AB-P1]
MSLLRLEKNDNDQLTKDLIVGDRQFHLEGSEGVIYFSEDNQFAVKIYRSCSDKRKEEIRTLIKLAKNVQRKSLLWPIAIAKTMNGEPCFGIVMKKAPKHVVPLGDLVFSPLEATIRFKQGWKWQDFFTIALNLAREVHSLHQEGFIHSDLHFNNILVDLSTLEVYIIDLDSVGYKNLIKAFPKGLWGFKAPEIILKNNPTIFSDLYSLGIIILWTILFRNVMLPQMCHDNKSQLNDYTIAYTEKASFSENEKNKVNWHEKIGKPLYYKGALSYRSLPKPLQQLTEQTFIDGVFSPIKRTTTEEWIKGLEKVMPLFIPCHDSDCQQTIFSLSLLNYNSEICPFCGCKIQSN